MQAIAKRQRVPIPTSDVSPTDFDLISALLPHSTPTALNEEDHDYEDERRTATLLLLRLAYAQAHAQLTSIAEEFELLRTVPPPPPPSQPGTSSDPARTSPEAERTSWTLDTPLHSAAAARHGGPLLDSAGKVCDSVCPYLCAILAYMNVCAAVAAFHDITLWRWRRPCETAGTGVPA